jgi:hypothetical protein
MDITEKSAGQPRVEEAAEKWIKIFNELGYAGFQKAEREQELDERFGEDNWITAHFFDGKIIPLEEAAKVYGEAYYEFLRDNPDIRDWIVRTASEVYDIQQSNFKSGLDFTLQECGAVHLQDIAVRRALTRLKLEDEGIKYDKKNLPAVKIFEGTHPVQIRGHKTEGYILNPGKVPFHRPELILDTEQKGWWESYSAEDFYQRNKVLLVKPDNFISMLAFVSNSMLLFQHEAGNYYSADCSGKKLQDSLRLIREKQYKSICSNTKDISFTEVAGSPSQTYPEWQKTINNLDMPYKGERRRIKFGDL